MKNLKQNLSLHCCHISETPSKLDNAVQDHKIRFFSSIFLLCLLCYAVAAHKAV